MADERQVEKLLAGVDGWNKWLKQCLEECRSKSDYSEDIKIDLMRAQLNGANLNGANLRRANLYGAHLELASLEESNLEGANLFGAHLENTNFRGAYLENINFDGSVAFPYFMEIRQSKKFNLGDADFRGTNLAYATLGGTDFKSINFSQTKGLKEVVFTYPSIISIDTLQKSEGKIPGEFLRGCGLSDWEIESTKLYKPGISTREVNNILSRVHDLRIGQALQINPLFISYSHNDSAFVDEMEKHLNEKGIRFWRDTHDATAGRLEKVVDRAIRQNPIELLILSENSVKSDWVEHEAHTARELEKELGRDVLCPVALDEAWKVCSWPARLREQIMEYNILDFSKWEDEREFGKMFKKLIDGLDLFYKEE